MYVDLYIYVCIYIYMYIYIYIYNTKPARPPPVHGVKDEDQSSGSNVILRRSLSGLAGLDPHMKRFLIRGQDLSMIFSGVGVLIREHR